MRLVFILGFMLALFAPFRLPMILLTFLGVFLYLLFLAINSKKILERGDEKQSPLFLFLIEKAGQQRKFRIALVFCSLMAILLTVVVGISYVPRRIQREIQGIEILLGEEAEGEFVQYVEVHIDGRIYGGLFARNSRFHGRIEIDVYAFTQGKELNFYFDIHEDFTQGLLRYRAPYVQLPRSYTYTLGVLHTDRDFSFLIIELFDHEGENGYSYGGGALEGYIIVAPVSNVEMALELLALKAPRN